MCFKSKFLNVVVASLLLSPAIAVSQDEIKDSSAMDDLLRSTYQSLNGKEIRVKGVIGTRFGEQLYFVDKTGSYNVKLDAGRKVRREIEGCKLELYETLKNSPCQLDGMAEVSIEEDDNIGDGITIEIILYQVDSLENSDDTSKE